MSSRRLLRRTPFAPPRAATRLHNRLRVRLIGRAVVAGGGRRRRLLLGGLLRKRKRALSIACAWDTRFHCSRAPTTRQAAAILRRGAPSGGAPPGVAPRPRAGQWRRLWHSGTPSRRHHSRQRVRTALAAVLPIEKGLPRTCTRSGRGRRWRGGPAILHFSRCRERQRHVAERARAYELNASEGAGERHGAPRPPATRLLSSSLAVEADRDCPNRSAAAMGEW
jgi:hypothetical protein